MKDRGILDECRIIKTEIEPVTEEHETPHLKQWTIHFVEIEEEKAGRIAEELSEVLEGNKEQGYWYADFKNDAWHYIIYPQKVFKVDRRSREQYEMAMRYGLALGIPARQVDFVKGWEKSNK